MSAYVFSSLDMCYMKVLDFEFGSVIAVWVTLILRMSIGHCVSLTRIESQPMVNTHLEGQSL